MHSGERYLFTARTDKSFYALEYTGHDFSEEDAEVEEEDAEAYLDTLAFDDYSKIIQELQSHRKEIEKLQTDMATDRPDTGPGGLKSLMEEEDDPKEGGEQTEGNQGSELSCVDLFGCRVSPSPNPSLSVRR